jgi:hypothetical protein
MVVADPPPSGCEGDALGGIVQAATKEKIAQEVLDWRHEGLIDRDLATLLSARFEVGPRLLSTALRWLGFFALLLFSMSVLGLIGMALGSAAIPFAPLLVGALSGAAWYSGVRMAADPERRFPTSGAVLLTGGLVGLFGTLALAFFAYGDHDFDPVYPAFMLVTALAAVATAYRYSLRWPLALGILLVFHALGNWHGYAGHGTYYLGIRDERLTAVAGLLAVAFGLWHKGRWEGQGETEGRRLGFGHLFVVFGLLYLNVSAWFLSLSPGGLPWVLLFSALGIAQLVAGARLRNPLFVGFGVVFLAIDLYTRFSEHFWNSLSKGAFFLTTGIAAALAGGLMELRARGERKAGGA